MEEKTKVLENVIMKVQPVILEFQRIISEFQGVAHTNERERGQALGGKKKRQLKISF